MTKIQRVVAKFGGSSVADAGQVGKVLAILKQRPEVRCVVTSAPAGITNLLYRIANGRGDKQSTKELLRVVAERFWEIVNGLKLDFGLSPHIVALHGAVMNPRDSVDFIVSRGEYIMGQILACALKCKFVDSKDIIRFNKNGQYNARATARNRKKLMRHCTTRCVMPGFYGAGPDGAVTVFTRGGSDVSAAIAADLISATELQKWTGVSGLYAAHPKIVRNPKRISVATYEEAFEMMDTGGEVLHPDAMIVVMEQRIPIHILNTDRPNDPGSWIVHADQAPRRKAGSVLGVTSRTGFSSITVIKLAMQGSVGFLGRLCEVLAEYDIDIVRTTDSGGTISVVAKSKSLEGKLEPVIASINRRCKPTRVEVVKNVALICVVGNGMVGRPGVSARILTAVARRGINVLIIDQGAQESTFTIGIAIEDHKKAVRAIYNKLIGPRKKKK